MTTSPPETKTGLRLGLATLAATGCLVAVLAASLPVRAADSDPVLAKVNGSEIRASDVALAVQTREPKPLVGSPASLRITPTSSPPAPRRWTRRPRRTTCCPS